MPGLHAHPDPRRTSAVEQGALNCDLLDWAKLRIAKVRREMSFDEMDRIGQSAADDYGFSARDLPYLCGREVEGLTVMQLAEREGVSPRTVKRQTRAERARLEAITGRAA